MQCHGTATDQGLPATDEGLRAGTDSPRRHPRQHSSALPPFHRVGFSWHVHGRERVARNAAVASALGATGVLRVRRTRAFGTSRNAIVYKFLLTSYSIEGANLALGNGHRIVPSEKLMSFDMLVIQSSGLAAEQTSSSFERKQVPMARRRHGPRWGVVARVAPRRRTCSRRMCTSVDVPSVWGPLNVSSSGRRARQVDLLDAISKVESVANMTVPYDARSSIVLLRRKPWGASLDPQCRTSDA